LVIIRAFIPSNYLSQKLSRHRNATLVKR